MKQVIQFITVTLLLFGCWKPAYTQVPTTFPYQAVARNASGNILANQAISVRFGIIDSVINGALLYKETHNITTNSLGLFSVNIGQGAPFYGTYSNINWGKNSKFLAVEMDPTGGNSFIAMGTSQLMSVPFAIHSKSTSSLPDGTGSGNTLSWNGTKWAESDNLYNNGYSVGIGTNTPNYKLDIEHNNGIGLHVNAVSGYSAVDIEAANSDAAIRFKNSGASKWNIRNTPSLNNLEILRNNNAAAVALLIENSSGFIGINKADPTEQLDVTGNAKISGTATIGSNLIVDGNKGIVRSDNATQLKTILYSGNITYSLAAGSTLSFTIGYSAFSSVPTISIGNMSGSIVHPEFILYTVRNATTTSATIDIYNAGSTTASSAGGTFRAIIIGAE